MISCEIISYAFAWRRCGYTAHAFSFSHPSPPVAVAQYSVGWSVFHGAHTAVLGIGVFGTSSSHHPYAQPQRHQGTCATDRWGHLSTTVLEDFNLWHLRKSKLCNSFSFDFNVVLVVVGLFVPLKGALGEIQDQNWINWLIFEVDLKIPSQ